MKQVRWEEAWLLFREARGELDGRVCQFVEKLLKICLYLPQSGAGLGRTLKDAVRNQILVEIRNHHWPLDKGNKRESVKL